MDGGDIEKDGEYMGKNKFRCKGDSSVFEYEMPACCTFRCRSSEAGKKYPQKRDTSWRLCSHLYLGSSES